MTGERAVLEDVARWGMSAPPAREAAVAAILAELGAQWDAGMPPALGGAPVAFARFVHTPSTTEFSLVPAASFAMGFSLDERAAVAAACSRADDGEHAAAWARLLARIDARGLPVPLAVGPRLVARAPLTVDQLATWIPTGADRASAGPEVARLGEREIGLWSTRSGWALPTATEWEHAARGGRGGRLAYLGIAPPDAALLDRILGAVRAGDLDSISNGYGLTSFGVWPELCADRRARGGAIDAATPAEAVIHLCIGDEGADRWVERGAAVRPVIRV